MFQRRTYPYPWNREWSSAWHRTCRNCPPANSWTNRTIWTQSYNHRPPCASYPHPDRYHYPTDGPPPRLLPLLPLLTPPRLGVAPVTSATFARRRPASSRRLFPSPVGRWGANRPIVSIATAPPTMSLSSSTTASSPSMMYFCWFGWRDLLNVCVCFEFLFLFSFNWIELTWNLIIITNDNLNGIYYIKLWTKRFWLWKMILYLLYS